MDLDAQLGLELQDLLLARRLRDTRTLAGPDRAHAVASDGRVLLTFCSNDYLGLASHPDVVHAACEAAAAFGFGAGASRLVSGEHPLHRELEGALARFLDRQAALLFPTGYQANIGVLTTLAGPDDLIVSDAANHASIIDGCRLSRAKTQVYPHLDAAAAKAALATPGSFRRRFLVTESLFSMDGDRAPLAELVQHARQHDAILIVDEAHALGVLGPNGRGLAAETGVRPDVIIGTLGKAFGAAGGFAVGSLSLRAILINRARPFIYTTASPPAIAAAALAALSLISSSTGDRLRAHVRGLAETIRARLRGLRVAVPGRDLILPLVIGSDANALDASASLLASGLLIPAIRPPTVPAGTARLRITVSASHRPDDVDALLSALAQLHLERL